MKLGELKFDPINEIPLTNDLELKDIGYCCSDCPSLIDILSINEKNDIIKFICSNKEKSHKKTLKIKEYLEKIKNFKKNSGINSDTCKEHNKIYKSYCLDCSEHLCEECQKFGIHICHHKINVVEIEPIDEELKIIEKIIDYYTNRIGDFERKNITLSKRMKEILNFEEEKISKIKNQKIKKLNDEKENSLETNKKQYLEEIKIIKEKFEKALKLKKINYENRKNEIISEYKLSKEKINFLYAKKEKMFKKKIMDKFNYLDLKKEIEKFNNIKTLEKNMNLFDIFNNIFFYNKEQTLIKDEILNGKDKSYLERIYNIILFIIYISTLIDNNYL